MRKKTKFIFNHSPIFDEMLELIVRHFELFEKDLSKNKQKYYRKKFEKLLKIKKKTAIPLQQTPV